MHFFADDAVRGTLRADGQARRYIERRASHDANHANRLTLREKLAEAERHL
jgi:hypothetical protein